MGASFVIIFGLLSSVAENTSESYREKGYLVIHNKPLSTTREFMLMK